MDLISIEKKESKQHNLEWYEVTINEKQFDCVNEFEIINLIMEEVFNLQITTMSVYPKK
jgi:hypothetical protein